MGSLSVTSSKWKAIVHPYVAGFYEYLIGALAGSYPKSASLLTILSKIILVVKNYPFYFSFLYHY